MTYTTAMCIICIDFEKGTMTAKEARRALGEMVPKVGAKHAAEVDETLRQVEKAAGQRSSSTP